MDSAGIWRNPPSKGDPIIWSDPSQLTSAILLITGALLPVVNPLGDAPILLRMTHLVHTSPQSLLGQPSR